MPEKDGSEDKKSTKSVVNKKQKQFMNQEEQLDLSSVAESFGGKIVGEPVELDEFVVSGTLGTAAAIKYGIPALIALGGTYLANRKAINKGVSDTISNIFTTRRRKKYNNQDTGGPTGGTRTRVRTSDLTPELEQRRKELDKNTADRSISNFFNRFKKNKNNNQSNKNNNNKFNKRDAAIGFGSGLGTSTAISTLTKGKKKGGGGFRLGGLPGTAHNVGRRTNPQ